MPAATAEEAEHTTRRDQQSFRLFSIQARCASDTPSRGLTLLFFSQEPARGCDNRRTLVAVIMIATITDLATATIINKQAKRAGG